MKTYSLEKLELIFKRFQENLPHPETELKYKNNYTLLVAVVLSAQATDKSVNQATHTLFETIDNPESMVKLGEEKLKTIIKSVGLYQTKARNVIALSQKLIDLYQGQVPSTFEALTGLPGVGRKTANVILNVAFDQPTIAVDTHIHRVSNRIGFCHTSTPEKTEQKLLELIPLNWRSHAHLWLVLHGRYICKSRKPECWRCPILDLCDYEPKNKKE